jgi:hypothetical protein
MTTLFAFLGRAGSRTAGAVPCEDVPLTFGFFAAGFFVVFVFLRDGLDSSSSALSCAVSLASASSSISDASFSTSSPPRFRFALADSSCAGWNFSGAFTARPDLRRPLGATGELAVSLFDISIRGNLVVFIDASAFLNMFCCRGVGAHRNR